MKSIYRLAKYVVMLAAFLAVCTWGAPSEAYNLSTPEDAWLTWFGAMASGDADGVLASMTTHGALGQSYKKYFNPLTVGFVSQRWKEGLELTADQAVLLFDLFRDTWEIIYLSDATVLLTPGFAGEHLGVSALVVKEGKDWKVSLLLNNLDLLFNPLEHY